MRFGVQSASHTFSSSSQKERQIDSSHTKIADAEKGLKHKDNKKKRKSKWFRKICRPQKIVQFLLEDWLFLAVLGVVMACLSLAVDIGTDKLQTFHVQVMDWADNIGDPALNVAMTYVTWMLYTVIVLMASAVFTHYVAPQAIGSGIPEVKTILRGVALKEYLSLRTLVSKLVGLTLSIGSGFPIGKEGPFVHVGSMVANLISRLVRNFQPAYANESRAGELLAAGCAAGVACTFSAPVGGVLFSIEVTAVYFAVRDYWRGFFAACCGAALFSLLKLSAHSSQVTMVAFYQTYFTSKCYYPEELFFFALIGLFCGLAGAIFILIHRHLVLFLRRNCFMKMIFQRNWIVYPLVVSIIYATLTYPKGIGRYITGEVVFSRTLKDFFINCTWHANFSRFEACNQNLTSRWSADESIFLELTFFIIGFYFLAIVASTLPVAAGIFMPVFVLGAAMGRFFGEVMAHNFPNGLHSDRELLIYPGVYSVVGAASFCGAVTHTISVAVIAFELTGQLVHILPVMIAVIIANITCSTFQPSFFDSIIKIKHLPYLPDIPKSTSEVHSIRVEQIMVRNVKSLSKKSTYRELQDILISMPRLRAFPIVDDPTTNVLLGSINRTVLLTTLEAQVGEDARKAEVMRRAQIELQVIGVGDAIQEITSRRERKRPVFSIGEPDVYQTIILNNETGERVILDKERFTVVPVYLQSDDDEGKKASANLQLPTCYKRSLTDAGDLTRIMEGSSKGESLTADEHPDGIKTSSSSSELRADAVKKRNKLLTTYSAHEVGRTIGGMLRNFTHTFHRSKKGKNDGDMSPEERREWERYRLGCVIDFTSVNIDPAPFQLVEDTSLYKVHSLFSLLGIRRAYVTKCGVLVGVVALREVRMAIERAHSGQLTATSKPVNAAPEANVLSRGTDKVLETSDSEGGPADSESETDNEDCIMPRVELEEQTEVADALNEKLPMVRTSTNEFIEEPDAQVSRASSSSSESRPAMVGRSRPHVLESYLEQCSDDPSKQIRVIKASSSPDRKSDRRLLIVEPIATQRTLDNNCDSIDKGDWFVELKPQDLENNTTAHRVHPDDRLLMRRKSDDVSGSLRVQSPSTSSRRRKSVGSEHPVHWIHPGRKTSWTALMRMRGLQKLDPLDREAQSSQQQSEQGSTVMLIEQLKHLSDDHIHHAALTGLGSDGKTESSGPAHPMSSSSKPEAEQDKKSRLRSQR